MTAHELADPPAGENLKFIALGFGIQNYTCANIGDKPTATGALAMLYDITSLYPGGRRGSLDQNTWNSLTSKALDTHEVPLNRDSSTAGRLPSAAPGADAKNPFPQDAPLKLNGLQPIPFLGHHFFNSAGTPQFVLDHGKDVLYAQKLDQADAPATADKGPDGTGAVAWLQLNDKGGSVGINLVYRVLTAGGNSHGCTAVGSDSTAYAAEYWFYGP